MLSIQDDKHYSCGSVKIHHKNYITFFMQLNQIWRKLELNMKTGQIICVFKSKSHPYILQENIEKLQTSLGYCLTWSWGLDLILFVNPPPPTSQRTKLFKTDKYLVWKEQIFPFSVYCFLKIPYEYISRLNFRENSFQTSFLLLSLWPFFKNIYLHNWAKSFHKQKFTSLLLGT